MEHHHMGYNARNLPNKISSSASTDPNTQTHQHLPTVKDANGGVETATNSILINNIGALASTLQKAESYDELSAYTDAYQHTNQ